jgi:tetratricopeptide (TPR) repeat protein
MNSNQTIAEEFVKQANALHRQGDYEQAIAAYREAIALMPDAPTYVAYHFMIGDMLVEMQRYEEAILAFRETVEVIPHYDEAWFKLGQCLMALKQDEEAVQAFDRCLEIMLSRSDEGTMQPFYQLEIDDRTGQAWYYGAIAHARLGQTDQAAKYLEEALQLRSDWKRRAQQDPLLREYLSEPSY